MYFYSPINLVMKYQKEDVFKQYDHIIKNTLIQTLDIELVDVGSDFLILKMPVTPKVHQLDGVLHGGATVALAETCGSFAAEILMNTKEFFVRGIEISANHLKSIREGWVFAKATVIHKGRTTQLFEIRVTDEDNNLISLCKLTTISLPRK